MLEAAIVALPGIITALVQSKIEKNAGQKKILALAIIYTIFINLMIVGGLWIIGVRDFNLFDRSLRFKIKWFILGIVLGLLMVLSRYNISKTKRAEQINVLKRIFPPMLLFVVTYAVFTPNALFLNNINEFGVSYIEIVPIVLSMSILLLTVMSLAGIFLFNNNNVIYYSAFIFAVSICAYVQSNFLNPKFGPLIGDRIDWSYYSAEGIISLCFWILCLIILFTVFHIYKTRAENIMKYFSYFLSAVQISTLIVLLFTTKFESNLSYVFLKNGEFTIGVERNIVIFVVDSLQASAMQEYLDSDAYREGALEDFTFFNNAVSGGTSTNVAMPLLVTGIEHDPLQPRDEYINEIWEETVFYDYLHENSYDVRMYSDSDSIPGIPEGIVENCTYDYAKRSIGSYSAFGNQLYKLVNFYVMPQFLKEKFWLSTTSMLEVLDVNENIYNSQAENISFYNDIKEAGTLKANYKNAFRLYHLFGVHPPHNTNENLEPDEQATEQQQLIGVMKEIYEYIDYMKEAGVYDSCLFIITGDHGPMEIEKSSPEANPAILIKMPNASHALKYSSAPICFRNVFATCASVAMEDYSSYGPSAFDITEESDVERLHTLLPIWFWKEMSWYDDDKWDGQYIRIITPNDLSGTPEYKIWDPYEINRIDYDLGENIDYVTNNDYAQQLDYRLYKENSSAIASNELSICFNLNNYSGGDLQFRFTYSKIYNNEQNVRIYANGSRIAKVKCLEADKGNEHTVTIPEDKIKDNTLVLRLVFPNAVTPNQIDRTNMDTRVLSVAFDSMLID